LAGDAVGSNRSDTPASPASGSRRLSSEFDRQGADPDPVNLDHVETLAPDFGGQLVPVMRDHDRSRNLGL